MKKLNVNIPGKDYTIYIENGSLNDLGENIKKIFGGEKIAVITDDNVNRLYGKRIRASLEEYGFIMKVITVAPGENSKSMETLKHLYNELLDFSMTRSSLILAFGGGVIGDLAGFSASTFLRGIPFIQIPTSLLAQIDSSVGGKVAINLEKGKNLVGNFYQPRAVFIDPDLLGTLSTRYFHDGMGEIIKYGCIKDIELFEKLSLYKTEKEFFLAIEEIIYRCIDIKREIIERDEMDIGERMLLNFGHTLGHGIEQSYNFEYSHGEAVAIGMYNITKKSEEMGLTKHGTSDIIKNLLEKYKLPHKMPDIKPDELIRIISLDKKIQGNYINIVLLEKIGNAYIKKIQIKDIEQFI